MSVARIAQRLDAAGGVSVTAAMTYARALRIAHSPHRASDIELSLAYDSLEAYELLRDLDDAERREFDDRGAALALNKLDVEMCDRERYFPACSRAGTRGSS